MMREIRLPFIFIIFAILYISPARNQSTQAEELTAEMLLKLLSLNQNPAFHRADTMRFEIVYDETDSLSQKKAGEYLRIISGFQHPPFKGKPLSIGKHPNIGLDNIHWNKISAVLIIPGKNNRILDLLEKSRQYQTLLISTDAALIDDGVSIAVEVDENLKPQIYFNLSSLKIADAVYDAQILELAKYMIW